MTTRARINIVAKTGRLMQSSANFCMDTGPCQVVRTAAP